MKRINRGKIIWGIALVLWMGFIFYMSQENGDTSAEISGRITGFLQKLFFPEWKDLPQNEFIISMGAFQYLIRKTAHFTEYLILGGLSCGFFHQFRLRGVVVLLVSFLFGTFYAVTDECHQLFVSGRAGQLFDICVDSAGVFIGIMMFLGLFYLVDKNKTN